MRNWFRWTLFFGILAAAFLGIQALRQMDPFRHLGAEFYEAGMGRVGIRMEQVTLRTVSNGVETATIPAQRLDITQDRQEWRLFGVADGRLKRDGKPVATIAAEKASYDSRTRQVTARGAIVSARQGRFNLPGLVWNVPKQTLTATAPVKGALYNGPLEAQQVRIDLKTERLTAASGWWKPKLKEANNRPVMLRWATLAAEDNPRLAKMTNASFTEPNLSLTATNAAYLLSSDQLKADGSVTVVSPELRLNASSALYQRRSQSLRLQGKPGNGTATKQAIEVLDYSEITVDQRTGNRTIKDAVLFDTRNNTRIEAKSAIFNEKTNRLEATGNLTMSDPDMEIKAEKMSADTRARKAVITGNIRITVKPKPAKEGDDDSRRFPIRMTADNLEYFFGQRRVAILTGNVNARQELENGRWRRATAEYAYFDRTEEKLTVRGKVKLTDSEGNEFYPALLVAHTQEGNERVEMFGKEPGKRGVISLNEEEDANAENGEATPPPPPAPPTR